MEKNEVFYDYKGTVNRPERLIQCGRLCPSCMSVMRTTTATQTVSKQIQFNPISRILDWLGVINPNDLLCPSIDNFSSLFFSILLEEKK